MNIIEVDIKSNVVFSENGDILEIETYLDENENPCLPEECVSVSYVCGTGSFRIHVLDEEQLELISNAFD